MQLARRSAVTVSLTILTFLFSAESSEQVSAFKMKAESTSGNLLQFTLPTYTFDEVSLNGQTFQKPTIQGAGAKAETGDPDLPVLTTFYAVDPEKTYSANYVITESQILENVNIAPLQTWENKTVDEVVSFTQNANTYSDIKPYPVKNIHVSEPSTFRNLDIVTVSFTPFRYYPAQRRLEVITSAEIELVETGTTNHAPARPALRSRVFEKLYASLIVNYDRISSTLGDYQKPSILYILPGNASSIMTTLNPLLDWRHKSGYVVNTVSTTTTGTTTTSIKNYIQNAYDTWENPPEYVALVGDASGSYTIPTYFENYSSYNGEGDHPYTQLAGNDLLPEVLIGRLSFTTTTELATIVNKTIQYETNPYMGENWFTRACMVGDPSSSGISCIITKEAARQYLVNNGNYTDVRTVYSGSFPTQMVNNLNDGLTFFNYRGYYGVSGFTTGDISGLTNGFKLCVATVITCGTGSFASGTSHSEAFIRAGTPSQPKGGVVSVGTATVGTHTMFNNAVDMGFYYGVFVDGFETPSAALARGKLHLLNAYPSNPNNYVSIFTHWNNLMGDPALRMWTGIPQSFQASYITSMPRGTNFIDIYVANSDGNDMPNAFVTLLKGSDEVFVSGYTDDSGNLTLPVSSTNAGTLSLTITAKNYIPHQGSVNITDPEANVNLASELIIVDDDDSAPSQGNGDGLFNNGETVELTVPVHNFGYNNITGLTGTLIPNSDHVSVINNNVSYGNINAGDVSVPSTAFVIALDNMFNEGSMVELRLLFQDANNQSWNGMLRYNTAGTFLDVLSVTVLDNQNGVLDPGETAELQFILTNQGSVAAANVTASLNTNNPAVDITDNESIWSYINAGGSAQSLDHFTISAAEGLLPGTIIHLFLHITSSDGAEVLRTFSLPIGTVTQTDPLGPDEYGYYIYDSGDQIYSNAPFYNWIEVDERYGGSGVQMNISDNGDNDDDVAQVTLPFVFRMYGIGYSQITVCSNGWIAMGSTAMQSFRNYPIPGPGGPSPMIAAFWDDLLTSSTGRVYRYHDVDNHQFIIEWSQMRTYDNNSPETFQIILRDPAYYFTPTGDGEILIQFHTFNNTSAGNYSWGQVHGLYSTIGIEDHTAARGLQYTFNNEYPTAAMPLHNESAILITTRGSEIRMRGDVNQDGMMDVLDVLMLVDYILSQNISNLNPYLADMNTDEIINILDMIAIVQNIMSY